MALLSTRKRMLAAVGTAGVIGALAFGGIAYAVGDGGTGESSFVTVVNDPTAGPTSGDAPEGGSAPSQQDHRDCPEKNGSGSPEGSEDGQPPSQEPSPSESAENQSAENL